ncbi:hypothetical protein CBR_g55877 [Chara braunii]|uniref:Integrase catalytic domain-containing protein n=1 Tax=Chara braunii TaxID=69332 RepID=A0A388MDH9_CHABU|nr:hypothetical protein CBR_g55877 [Chara braunii]|eukprot:GBG92542.1 hypothetical protein CBR_g55877 [Chara braunii]
MPKEMADGGRRLVALDDLIDVLDKRERAPSNVPKVETFHFKGKRVSDWLDLTEQALVGLSDEVKIQRVLRYLLHSHHREVSKVVDAANGSWARFGDLMRRKYRLGDGLLIMADLEAMNKEDFSTIGAFVHEFKKKARKVHGISEEAQCATFLGLLTGLEAAELMKHGEGSEKLTWATIDKGVEDGSLDQVEQRQMRLQRRKRKERDATTSGTRGVKRIVTDVLAALGYDNEAEVQKRGVIVAQGRASGATDEEAGREDYGGEETGSQALTKAQRKQRNLLLGGQGSGKGQAPQAIAAPSPVAAAVPAPAGPSHMGPPPACGHWEEEEEGDDEEDERLRQEEDQRAEQRAKKREIQGEMESSLHDGAPKRKKYVVRLEEGFDVERMVDKLLEGHNDLMNLKDILASAPRLRGELKGRFSRRLVPNVHLSSILSREIEWTEAGTRMDWKCVACGLVDLKVRDQPSIAMVDTGAEMNIIWERDATMLGLEVDLSDHGVLHGANCKAIFCGTASNVMVEIGKVRAQTCFFVMLDVDHPIPLGRSFLCRTETLVFNRHEGTMILALSDPACRNYEIIKCRNTGPGSGRNRLNLGSFTFEESEYVRRRLREEQEEEGGGEVLSLSLNDVNKAMEVVTAHDMADPEVIKALREQAGPCRINDENEVGLIIGEPGFLSPQERTLMVETMKRRHCAYAFNDDERGRLDVHKIPMIRIHTVPHEPWNLKGARYPNPDEEKKVVDYLDGKMRTYVTDYSSGPYASPWFCFIKPNGTLRWVQDLQRLNAVTVRDAGGLPNADALSESCAGRPIISLIDLYSGYDQFPVYPPDRPVTAMHTPRGLIHMNVAPQGWTNAVAMVQRHMIRAMQTVSPHITQPYIDDLAVKGPKEKEEDEVMPRVRRRLILRVDPTALACSLKSYTPSDPTIARWLTYVWMFNFELERIPGDKNRADGLSRINWDGANQESIEDTPPVDGFLDQEEDVRLHINEWSLRVPSCVTHPIWLAPKGYERKEWVLKPFQEEDPWGSRDVGWMMKLALAGTHSLAEKVRTIEEGPTQAEEHEQLMGGMYLLTNTLLQGSFNQMDSFGPEGSELLVPESQDDEFEEGEIRETFRAEEYDGIYRELGLLLSCEIRDRDASAKAQKMRHLYVVRDDHLFIKRNVVNPKRIVYGRNRQIDVIAALHDGIAGGHRGVSATCAKISELYHWDGMLTMVIKYCQSCVPCQQRSMQRPGEPLHPRLEREVGAVVHLDLLFMPAGENECNYIFDARDNLTGFVDGWAIRTKKGPVLANYIEEYYLGYTFVKEFVMDRGSEFTCNEVRTLLAGYGVVANYTTVAHPQANAPVERGHNTITNLLAKWTEGRPGQWLKFLRAAFFVENVTVKKITKYVPATLWYARHATFPIESFMKTWRRQDLEVNLSFEELLDIRARQVGAAEERLREAAGQVERSRMEDKMRWDQMTRVRKDPLKVGDAVLLSDFSKAVMQRGGRDARPRQGSQRAAGRGEQHEPPRREPTPEFDDDNIELFLDVYRDHATQRGCAELRPPSPAPSGQEPDVPGETPFRSLATHLDVSRWEASRLGEGSVEPTRYVLLEEPLDPETETGIRDREEPQDPEMAAEQPDPSLVIGGPALAESSLTLPCTGKRMGAEASTQEGQGPRVRGASRETREEESARVRVHLDEIHARQAEMEAAGIEPMPPVDPKTSEQRIDELWARYESQRDAACQRSRETGQADEKAGELREMGDLRFSATRMAIEHEDRRICETTVTSFQWYSLLSDELKVRELEVEHLTTQLAEERARNQAREVEWKRRFGEMAATVDRLSAAWEASQAGRAGADGRGRGMQASPSRGAVVEAPRRAGPMGEVPLDTAEEEGGAQESLMAMSTERRGSRLQELAAAMGIGTPQERPQRPDAPDYAPGLRELRAELGSWATGTDSRGRLRTAAAAEGHE